MMRKNFMRSGICLYSWCTVPRMKFVFCLSARGVQFGFLLKLCAWKGKVSGMSTKFVFVTGGVVSGLGKGICAASLGRLLKQRGVRVRNQKFDPYINVDPGTMSPYQHGEVFVTEDGAETDLDLGHYERFVDEDLTGNSSVSSGKIYWSVLNRERRGDYLGATVQIIPHITDEIKRRIYAMAEEDVDVVITEIGGTVGDIESQPFLEAIRQVAAERPQGDVVFIHVPLIVQIPGSGELKSKPTQHSVKELLSLGIQPDILVCRCDVPITEDIRRKIALFCNVQPDCVIQNATAETLYEVPLLMAKEGLDEVVCRKLGLITHQPDLREWSAMVKREKNARKRVSIALVGKYTQLHDAYLSVVESLNHAGTANDAVVDIRWVDSETLTEASAAERLAGCSGILVPGGFGDRGIEGMIAAVRYAREHCIPYFGICLGMQMAVIEFARHVLGWADASSSEFSSTAHPVIDLMPDQVNVTAKGGTMRLGRYPCVLAEGSRSRELYGAAEISERHRHRYEFNNDFRAEMQVGGMRLAGLSPDGSLPCGRLPRKGRARRHLLRTAAASGCPSRPAASAVLWICKGLCDENGGSGGNTMNHFAKIAAQLESRDLDGMLLTHEANRFYASGFHSAGTDGMALVTREKFYYFTDSRSTEAARRHVQDAGHGRGYSALLMEAVQRHSIQRLGFEDAYMTVREHDAYARALPCELVPAADLLAELRAVKDPEELEIMIAAQRIAEKALTDILNEIRPGVTEKEIAARLQYLMLHYGAEDKSFDPIVVSGPNGSLPHGVPSEKVIQAGEFVTMDFGCIYHGYCSDMTRTVAVGSVTDEMRQVYDTVLQAQLAGIAAARAGATGKAVDGAARDIIRQAGYGPCFGHSFGHGVGVEIHEGPNATPSNDKPLPAGAVISAEPGIYLPGKLGVRIEDVLYLTPEGCQNLTLAPKELVIL